MRGSESVQGFGLERQREEGVKGEISVHLLVLVNAKIEKKYRWGVRLK